MSKNTTLADEIQIMINNSIQQQPTPIQCTITKTYNNNYVDAKTKNGELNYIKCIGANINKNAIGVVIFLDGGFDKCIIIT